MLIVCSLICTLLSPQKILSSSAECFILHKGLKPFILKACTNYDSEINMSNKDKFLKPFVNFLLLLNSDITFKYLQIIYSQFF